MPDGAVFRILGPLVVESDRGRAVVAAPKQRALLATLLLHPNEVVTIERIVEGVWGAGRPDSAAHLVQVYVSHLRRALRPVRLHERLSTEATGYRFTVAEGELDSAVFTTLASTGAEAVRAGNLAAAATALETALALWRGDALADVELEDEAARRAARLDEQRLVATETLIDVRLADGGSSGLVPELERLVSTYPLREGFRVQLMLSLYRAGRQADALAAYRNARAALDELGLEPSPQLRELEARILRQDPALLPAAPEPAEAEPAPAVAAVDGRKRRRVGVAVIAVSAAMVAAAVAVVVSGTGGPDDAQAAIRALPHAVSTLDERTGVLVASKRVGASPGRLAFGAGGLWVGDLDDHTLSLVDAESLRRRRIVGLPSTPSTLQVSGSVVWLGYGYSGRIGRYLVRSNTLVGPARPTPTATGLAAIAPTERDVWIGLQDGAVLAVDPVSMRVKTAAEAGRFVSLVPAGGAVWGIGFGSGEVARIDARTGRVRARTPVLGSARALAAGHGAVWVATAGPERLYRIDPATGRVTSTTPLGVTPDTVVVGRDAVWVASGLDGELQRVDPERSQIVSTVRIGRPILALASDGAGRIFVAEG